MYAAAAESREDLRHFERQFALDREQIVEEVFRAAIRLGNSELDGLQR